MGRSVGVRANQSWREGYDWDDKKRKWRVSAEGIMQRRPGISKSTYLEALVDTEDGEPRGGLGPGAGNKGVALSRLHDPHEDLIKGWVEPRSYDY